MVDETATLIRRSSRKVGVYHHHRVKAKAARKVAALSTHLFLLFHLSQVRLALLLLTLTFLQQRFGNEDLIFGGHGTALKLQQGQHNLSAQYVYVAIGHEVQHGRYILRLEQKNPDVMDLIDESGLLLSSEEAVHR